MKRTVVLTFLCIIVMFFCIESIGFEKRNSHEETNIHVSFLAVGDNLIHSSIYKHHRLENGGYDFRKIYQYTNALTQSVDVAYINQETICAGEELGLSNYPQFNGPLEVIDALNDAGFDWISSASNHSMDRGEKGILKQLDYIQTHYPNMIMSGIHRSKEEAHQNQVIVVNGLKIGLLNYTYGLNGNALPKGKEYLVDIIDKERIQKDMDNLNQISDIQIVAMHWGNEYQFSPTENQRSLAQYLCDLGVDVIIGNHPHVIQPVEFIHGQNNQETLVMYSLGNFLSAQDKAECMLGGMMLWDIEYNKSKKTISFQNVQFLPTVTQIADKYNTYRTYLLKDWSNEHAKQHVLYQKGLNVSREAYIDIVQSVIKDKVKVVYE